MSTKQGHILIDKPLQPVSDVVWRCLPEASRRYLDISCYATNCCLLLQYSLGACLRPTHPDYHTKACQSLSISGPGGHEIQTNDPHIIGYVRLQHFIPSASSAMNPSLQSSSNPRLNVPLHAIHKIIDALKHDFTSLKRCSLVAKTWHPRSRKWLFATVVIKSLDFRFGLAHGCSPGLSPGTFDDKTPVIAHVYI